MVWVKFIIDVPMECFSLFLRSLMADRLERLIVYVFQFMNRFEAGANEDRGVLENLSTEVVAGILFV